MKKIGFITYKESPELSDSDMLLIEPMLQFGYDIQPAPWDDQSLDFTKFDSLIFRSCWNYHYKIEEFTNWLDYLEKQQVKTWNPIKIVKWNMDKFYLEELRDRFSINVIPTSYVQRGSNPNLKDLISRLNWNEVVVKPSVGASAYKIFKSTIEETYDNQFNLQDMLLTSSAMIQPLIPELVNNGEISLIFLNKQFSHAVNRRPKQGDFRSNYSFGGTETRIEVGDEIIEAGKHILSKIESPLLYSRVDGVVVNEKFMLMELELIEPYLFMDICQESPAMFAKAFNELNRSI